MKNTFTKNGYYIHTLSGFSTLLEIEQTILTLVNKQIKGGRFDDLDQALIHVYSHDKKAFLDLYSVLNYLSVFNSLLAAEISPVVSELCDSNIIGFDQARSGVRFDFPDIDVTRFLPHQDSPYNFGGNKITAWIPLRDTFFKQGSIRIYPQSHQLGQLQHAVHVPKGSSRKLVLLEFEQRPYEELYLKRGEALFFDQNLVHASGVNTSDKVRISLLGRYHNFLDSEWLEFSKTTIF